jgi:cytochrome c-type biogenesis protein CcmE
MKKYGKFAALIVIIVGTLIWLATAGIKENQTYYKTLADLSQMGDQAYAKRLRVAGDVGKEAHRVVILGGNTAPFRWCRKN